MEVVLPTPLTPATSQTVGPDSLQWSEVSQARSEDLMSSLRNAIASSGFLNLPARKAS